MQTKKVKAEFGKGKVNGVKQKKNVAHVIFNRRNGIQWVFSVLQTTIKMRGCIKKGTF